ncbi:MAG: ATPase, T2SS/T4P/T4SS family [Pseudomonadota bacterium]
MSLAELQEELIRDLFGPIQKLLDEDSVSEVLINGPFEIYFESNGKLLKAANEYRFADEVELEALVRAILQYVGKQLPPINASEEARLPDGSRVHVVRISDPPDINKSICVSVRKFKKDKLSLDALVEGGALPDEIAKKLQDLVEKKKNFIISGGTGTGKTTMLNCLSEAIGDEERVIVIEDAAELQLRNPHVVRMEVRAPDKYGQNGLSIGDLFRASLRMRPDRIIVGECRGPEAFDMIQAMSSGHSGSLSTIHADTPDGAMSRIETLALAADAKMPHEALRRLIGAAVDVVVQIHRTPEGVRETSQVALLDGVNDDTGEYGWDVLYSKH